MIKFGMWLLLIGACTMAFGCSGESEPIEEESVEERAKVVFTSKDGKVLTAQDLNEVSDTVDWEVIGEGAIPVEAQNLHEQGRAAGGKGDYAGAIACFEKAATLAPDWAYPVYDHAYTLMLQGDSDRALALYESVDQMEPAGFFTTKTALYALRGEKDGTFPPGIYLAYIAIEWESDPAKKEKLIRGIASQVPNFAPIWKEMFLLLSSQDAEAGELLDVLDKGLDLDPDGETRGILLINMAATLDLAGRQDEAIQVLGELALDDNATLANQLLAKQVLAQMVSREEGE